MNCDRYIKSDCVNIVGNLEYDSSKHVTFLIRILSTMKIIFYFPWKYGFQAKVYIIKPRVKN